MPGHIQETKQSVVETLEALEPENSSTRVEGPRRTQALKPESNGDILTDNLSE